MIYAYQRWGAAARAHVHTLLRDLGNVEADFDKSGVSQEVHYLRVSRKSRNAFACVHVRTLFYMSYSPNLANTTIALILAARNYFFRARSFLADKGALLV